MTISNDLSFEHGQDHNDEDCTFGDTGLLFVERYIGEQARTISSFDGVELTMSGDALSDETTDVIDQWVECRYCDGERVKVIDDVLRLSFQ